MFPWVIADYESDSIDLNDPACYRDLSKPMGAIGEKRRAEFEARYEAWEDDQVSRLPEWDGLLPLNT